MIAPVSVPAVLRHLRKSVLLSSVVAVVAIASAAPVSAEQITGQSEPISIETECESGMAGLRVNFSLGVIGHTVVITVGDRTPVTVLDPNSNGSTAVVSGIPSGVYDISYTVDSGDPATHTDVDLVCPQPPVVTLSCRDGQIYFTYTLDGTKPEWRYVVDLYLSDPDEDVDVYFNENEAPDTRELGPLTDGATYAFLVNNLVVNLGGRRVFFKEYTLNCEEILASQGGLPGTGSSEHGLPGTGSSAEQLALIAGALLAVGVALAAAVRLRRA